MPTRDEQRERGSEKAAGLTADLSGRSALVTGAGRGLGRASAIALAAAGASVLAVSRTEEELETLTSTIEKDGGTASYRCFDITDLELLEGTLADTEFDIVVNSAGVSVPQPFLEVDAETLETVLRVNLIAVFQTCQVAARSIVRRGGGASIINITSEMGHVGSPDRTVYCMSKHGLEGLTKAMALELAAHQIRVNSIAPTYVRTPMTREWLDDPSFLKWATSQIPLGRIGEPSDVTNAVLYLASDASRMMTGATVLLDGGWTAK